MFSFPLSPTAEKSFCKHPSPIRSLLFVLSVLLAGDFVHIGLIRWLNTQTSLCWWNTSHHCTAMPRKKPTQNIVFKFLCKNLVSVNKMLLMQTWGPKFKSPAWLKSWEWQQEFISPVEGQKGGSLELTCHWAQTAGELQVQWKTLSPRPGQRVIGKDTWYWPLAPTCASTPVCMHSQALVHTTIWTGTLTTYITHAHVFNQIKWIWISGPLFGF